MALTQQEQNFVARLLNLAETTLNLRDDIIRSRAEWDLNDFFTGLEDADLQEVVSFQHLTKSEVANVINALDEIVSALGDTETGQLANLIKARS